jgi:hypothetical protein
MTTAKKEKVCSKCRKPMLLEQNFYKTPLTDKYEDGYLDECKKCFTMHINIREPGSFLHLLEAVDVPYIESEWNTLVEKYGNNPKTTSTAIYGRYIAKMKLKQFSKYTYADTEKFVEEAKMRDLRERAAKLAEINKYRDALESGEAVENIQTLGLDLSVLDENELRELMMKPEEMFEFDPGVEAEAVLTREDKEYLVRKWGKTYTIPECIKLEKLYNEMMSSYDIRTASHIDYLLKICRISLKIDQALEVNDIDGFQKMSRVYDLLMKSAKFTAAQNKDAASDYTDSIGMIVSRIEEEQGYIPRYHSERQDVVDATLADMNKFTRDLIMSELNLGNMIEVYLQKMQMEENKEEDVLDDDDDDLIILTEKEVELLKDEDFEEYNDMLEEEREIDEEMLRKSGESYD